MTLRDLKCNFVQLKLVFRTCSKNVTIPNLISGDINSGTTSNYQKMSSPVKLRLNVKTSRANQNVSKMIKVGVSFKRPYVANSYLLKLYSGPFLNDWQCYQT